MKERERKEGGRETERVTICKLILFLFSIRRLSSRKKRRQNRHSADTSLLPPPLPAVNNAPHLQEPPLLMTRPSPLTPPQAHHQGCVVGTTPLVANCSTQYIPIGALPQHSQGKIIYVIKNY